MATMGRQFRRVVAGVALVLAMGAARVAAQGGSKEIDPPGGGKIVYGQVQGQTTEAGAMGSILKSIHNSLGEKPQVGQLFQVRGSDSTSVFFNVKRKNVSSGQVSGLIIATKTGPNQVEAALVSDDASRFSKNLPGMMKTLFGQWHPFPPSGSGSGVRSGDQASSAPAVLHQQTLRDGSASVGLPDSWQMNPQSAMGTIFATGPNGEMASLGMMFLASDTNNPRVQQTMRTVQAGGLRNTVYARAFYYPYGGDMVRTFVDTLQHARQQAGQTPAKYNISSATPMQSGPRMRCSHLEGTVDFADGKGLRELNVLYCVGSPSPMGSWASLVSGINAPMAVAASERATLGAILSSFSVDQAKVAGEAAQLAAPSIAQTHAIGDMVTKRINATHAIEDEHNRQIEKYWDNNDKHSQEFENYQLGMSVISDSQNQAHATLWDQDAQLLVSSNPDRFQYVSAPDYWKGIDY